MYRTKFFNNHNSDEIIALLYSVFNTSYDGLFVCDSDGYPLFYNDALMQITGLTSEDLNSDSAGIFDALEVNLVPNVCAAIALKTKETSSIIVDYPNGKKAIITATPYFNQKGTIQFVVSNLRDITEMKRIQKELEETQQINKAYQTTLKHLQNKLGSSQQLVYGDKSMDKVVSQANRFAENNLPILLLGESGVGKDVLAHYIHDISKRDGSFIKINCGAIPENLLESELFGYEKGAFTGASEAKKGLIELAHKGILFLDEIGDLPFALQVKLLNVLQDYKIRRLGGTAAKEVDVRIIAATNIDLESLIELKKFRLDLYYRLNVLTINIPALRERKEDIPSLTFHFLEDLGDKYKQKKHINTQVYDQFMAYHWPGNIRELKNIIERLYHLSEDSVITIEDLPSNMKRVQIPDNVIPYKKKHKEDLQSLKDAVNTFEREYISYILEKSSSLQECANHLGISLSTLVRKKRNIYSSQMERSERNESHLQI